MDSRKDLGKGLLRLKDAGIRFLVNRRVPNSHRNKKIEFWALRGISFDMNAGDVLGIVGRNGAGKSTLARLLAGVYEPSEGDIVRTEEVTLLSLGAGFSAELTGRQNIRINGAYLGFTRSEIEATAPEIIEFSELDEFIDQPVRTYSSGMRSRLTFSIAVHMSPKVLIVDEVLSTGDRQFKIKAKNRLKAIMDDALAVVIISHSEATIRELCNRAVWLEGGMIKMQGEVNSVLDAYEKLSFES